MVVLIRLDAGSNGRLLNYRLFLEVLRGSYTLHLEPRRPHVVSSTAIVAELFA
jgi:hypothetical protein